MACKKAKRKCCKFGFRKGTMKCKKSPKRGHRRHKRGKR